MQKVAKKKVMTLDTLAGMVQRGFEVVNKDIHDFREEMNIRLGDIETRLDHLEKALFEEQHERIMRLEDRVQKMEGDFRALLSGKR